MYKTRTRQIAAAVLTFALLLALFPGNMMAVSSEPRNGGFMNDNSVTFSVYAEGESVPHPAQFQLELRCGDGTAAQARLTMQGNDSLTVPHRVAGQTCAVWAGTGGNAVLGNEVQITVSGEEGVIARSVLYPEGGTEVVSSDFYVPQGKLEIDVRHEFTEGSLGTRVRVLEWNLWGGGRSAGGQENVEHIIEVIRRENPDVLFTIETYASGERILEGINEGLPENLRYNGIKVTNQAAHQPNDDNLWIFTRYPVVKQYPIISHSGLMSGFHFGGIKIRLPDGQEVNLFNTWLYHDGWAWDAVNQTVGEITYGIPRTYTNAEIVATDLQPRRMQMIRKILYENYPRLITGDASPIIMAGDFNTLSAEDWSLRFADAPGHEGLVLQWPVTTLIQEEGFTDTYRWANPDAARYPGSTWSPYSGYGMAPGRIDYIWTKGQEIRVLGSYTVDEKLPEHQDSTVPFYSDHAAVVTDLMIRNSNSLPGGPKPVDHFVPWFQMKATSTSQHVGYEASKAIDGNRETMWHTEWAPHEPLPQSIILDLGSVYHVTGLDYQTRTDFKPDGIVTEYNIYGSVDGENFFKIEDGVWEHDYSPKRADFQGTDVRFIRLEATQGSGNAASAAEIKVRYQP